MSDKRHNNKDSVSGIMPLMPLGTNSTMFTDCCRTAINNYEIRCPICGMLVVGHDAENDHERGKIRWMKATAHWRR